MPYVSETARTRGGMNDVSKRRLIAVGVVLVYAALIHLGVDMAVPAFGLSGFALATGLLLATLGRRPWPTLVAGLPLAAAVNVAVRFASGQRGSTVWLLVAADMLDLVVATLLLRRFLGTRSSLERPLGVMWAAIAVAAGAVVSAPLGVAGAELTDVARDLGSPNARAALLWFAGRLLGGLVTVSLVDAWRLKGRDRRIGVRATEVIVVVAVVLLSGGIGAAVPRPGTFAAIAAGALRTIALLWLPVRIGRRATATALAVLVYEYAALTITGEVAPFGLRLVWVDNVDELTLGIGTTEILLSLITTVLSMVILSTLFAERRRSLREARASEERFRAIAESINDALIVADTEHRITFANDAAAAMLLRNDLVGAPLASLMPDRIKVHDELTIGCFGDEPIARRMGCFIQRADGHELPVEVALSSYEIGDGERAVAIVMRDQTERQQTERELRRAAEDLERSNTDLAEFAYIASHDLQEPLRMVASFLRLLEERYQGKLDETADAYIGYAVDGAERLNALVTDLLRYSRAGTTVLERRAVDLSGATNDALEMLRMQKRGSGAEVRVDPLPTVSGNPTLLTQVMQNLLSNAMKFHAPGVAPQVEVTSRASAEGPIVVVVDHGIGIPEDQREQVFQPFRRLHAREAFTGNGIGLSVCRKIIERHGGSIWLEETPGGGTTACFQLQPALRRIA